MCALMIHYLSTNNLNSKKITQHGYVDRLVSFINIWTNVYNRSLTTEDSGFAYVHMVVSTHFRMTMQEWIILNMEYITRPIILPEVSTAFPLGFCIDI